MRLRPKTVPAMIRTVGDVMVSTDLHPCGDTVPHQTIILNTLISFYRQASNSKWLYRDQLEHDR